MEQDPRIGGTLDGFGVSIPSGVFRRVPPVCSTLAQCFILVVRWLSMSASLQSCSIARSTALPHVPLFQSLGMEQWNDENLASNSGSLMFHRPFCSCFVEGRG